MNPCWAWLCEKSAPSSLKLLSNILIGGAEDGVVGALTLKHHRLVAYRKPMYQVLALDNRRDVVQADTEAASLGQILQQLAEGRR